MANAWSESGLNTVEGCPKARRLKKAKVPVDLGDALRIGAVAHDAIEKYIDRCVRNGVPEMIEEIPAIVWGCSEKASEKIRKEVLDLLTTFADRFPVKVSNPETEVAAAFDANWRRVGWNDWDTVRWRAKLDLVERFPDAIRITDWKTGWKLPTRKESEEASQLRSYAFVASRLYPAINVFRIRYYFVRSGFEHEFELHRDELHGIAEDLKRRMERADRLAATDTATPGPNCEGCFYRRSCDRYREVLADGIPDETKDLAETYLLLKAKTKDVEAAIKARIEAEGPVDVGDGKLLGFHPSERWGIDEPQAGIGRLLELGVSGAAIYREISLSKTAIGKLLKGQFPEREEREKHLFAFLRSYGATSGQTRFEAKKPKPRSGP